MNDIAIEVRNVTKRFGKVTALDDVSIDVRYGEVLGLIGQNGSGKSSLLKILAGISSIDAGRIIVVGKEVTFASPIEAEAAGVGIVHQEQSLFGNLTVAENLFLGRRIPAMKYGFIRWRSLNRETRTQFKKIGLNVEPSAILDTLSFSDRQLVELVKVLTLEERIGHRLVILFDEPTSVLGSAEIQTLFRQIRRLRDRAAVVFVSHRMDEVMEISDRVYVMADGRCMAERDTSDTNADELFELMVGRKIEGNLYGDRKRKLSGGEIRLKIDNLGAAGAFSGISFALRAGEILSVTGVAGSGAEEMCRSLAGITVSEAGSVLIDGEKVLLDSPSKAVKFGIAYVPAERKTEAITSGRSVHENMVLPHLRKLSRGGILMGRLARAQSNFWMKKLAIKAHSKDAAIDGLSGGNQQKVVLGRWMMSEDIKILIMDRPTRGLDPGAKIDVYNAIREMADRGVSIIYVADTLEETVGLADQTIVMRDGVVSKHFDDVNGQKPEFAEIVKWMV